MFTHAQTDTDALMMDKKNLCIGVVYQSSTWNKYWEGTFKRENLNLGDVSAKSYNVMGNYGITDNLNVIFSLPYVKTNATAGTLKGQEGLQDFSLTAKYMPFEKTIGKSTIALYTLGGFSIPTTNYVADFLPLSIGLQSKTTTLRLMGDYQYEHFFTTLSGAYIFRSNIKIDRDAYYTTDYHYTNEVFMPNQVTTNFKIGYRSTRLIAEANYESLQTLAGGFDITTNNMPFPSNTMNWSKIGVYAKYTFKSVKGLSLVGGYNSVISGRNVGQSKTINGGVFYILNFNKK